MRIDKHSVTWETVRSWADLRLKKARKDLESRAIQHSLEDDAERRAVIDCMKSLLELENKSE